MYESVEPKRSILVRIIVHVYNRINKTTNFLIRYASMVNVCKLCVNFV